jgi:NAD(P)-dependent dehydrogenase (short-subunit alcohol dehydrogenase family)
LHDDARARETIGQCRACGVQAELLTADLSQSACDVIPQLCTQILAISPTVSLLLNNAGTYCDVPFLEMDWATYQRTMRLNVDAGYFLTQALARHWVQNGIAGRVLFTGSINGELAEPDHSAYDTSKGAVRTMVRSLCVALAPHQIRVNALAPGLIATPLTQGALTPAAMAWMQLHTPNGQVPGPEACSGAALFLLSDEAEHVHGQTLLVDGGMSVWQQPNPPDTWGMKLPAT